MSCHSLRESRAERDQRWARRVQEPHGTVRIFVSWAGLASCCSEAFLERRLENAVSHEQEEALEIGAREREQLTEADWKLYGDSYYAFNRDAFLYYFPSILSCTFGDKQRTVMLTDSIVGILNCRSDEYRFNEFFMERYYGWYNDEYDALIVWLHSLSPTLPADPTTREIEELNELSRAIGTVERVKSESGIA